MLKYQAETEEKRKILWSPDDFANFYPPPLLKEAPTFWGKVLVFGYCMIIIEQQGIFY